MARILAVVGILAAFLFAACSGDDAPDPTDAPADECLATGRASVGAKPWAVASDAATNRLYSADEFDNTVTIIDLCTHEQVAKVNSGTGPNSISVNHKTGVAFISNFNSNDVTVIESDAVTATMPAGSVMLFDSALWHGGGANTSDARRYAFSCAYCWGWMRQQENLQLGIPRETAARFPRRLQELCGYSVYKGQFGHIDNHDPIELLGRERGKRMVWEATDVKKARLAGQ